MFRFNAQHRAPSRPLRGAAMAAPDNVGVLVFDQGVRTLQRLTPCIDRELNDIDKRIRAIPYGNGTCLAPALAQMVANARALPSSMVRVATIISDGECFDLAAALAQADAARVAWVKIHAILIGDSAVGADQLRQIVGRTVGGVFTRADGYRQLTAAVLSTRKRNHGRTAAHFIMLDISPSMSTPLPDAPHLRRLDGAASALAQFVASRRHLHG